MTDRAGASWGAVLSGTLHVAGGVTVALGAVRLLAPPLGCDRAYATAVIAPIGALLVARTMGRGMGDGVSGVLRRMLGVALGGAILVGLFVAALNLALGPLATRPSGALALMTVGLVAALAGRLRRGAGGGALVTAREWAATDDAVVVGVVTMLAAAATVGADVGPMVAAVVRRLDVVSTPLVGALLLAVLGFPVMGVVSLAAPRGRSPVARGLLLAGLAALLGAGSMYLAGAGPAAVAESTTMIDDRIAARVDAWQASLAVGAIGAWVGAIVAALVALGAGIRARAHGVIHDQQERRASVLEAALLTSAVLIVVVARLQASLPAPWNLRPALSAVIFAAIGVMAVHMGVAALGEVRSPLQHRAGGYIASAAVSAVVAVLLAALGSSLAALCRVRVEAPFDWLAVLADASRARRVVFAVGASFVVPVLAAVVVAGYRRGARLWAVTAARHLAYAVLATSVAMLLVGARLPQARDAVAGPWTAAVPASLELPQVALGEPCHGLHHARVLVVGEDGIQQGELALGQLEALATEKGCAAVAERVTLTHRALTVAVDRSVAGGRLACLLRAIGQRAEGAPETCEVQLLARDDAGIPRCASGSLGVSTCRNTPAPHLAHLSEGGVVVDLGDVPARLRAGRFPDDAYLWETDPFASRGVALWPSGEVDAGALVDLWYRLRARTPHRAPFVLELPTRPVVRPTPPADDVEVSFAATVTADSTEVARALEGKLWSRRGALARCHRGGGRLAEKASASYRMAIGGGGRLDGVVAATSRTTRQAARCVTASLADVRLEGVSKPTLVVLELHVHERPRSPPPPEDDELPPRL